MISTIYRVCETMNNIKSVTSHMSKKQDCLVVSDQKLLIKNFKELK
jgi:hypothetical protein